MKGIDSVDEIIGKENVIIRNMHDFVKEIPRAVYLRKSENIEPGAKPDPVALLFR